MSETRILSGRLYVSSDSSGDDTMVVFVLTMVMMLTMKMVVMWMAENYIDRCHVDGIYISVPYCCRHGLRLRFGKS